MIGSLQEVQSTFPVAFVYFPAKIPNGYHFNHNKHNCMLLGTKKGPYFIKTCVLQEISAKHFWCRVSHPISHGTPHFRLFLGNIATLCSIRGQKQLKPQRPGCGLPFDDLGAKKQFMAYSLLGRHVAKGTDTHSWEDFIRFLLSSFAVVAVAIILTTRVAGSSPFCEVMGDIE